MVDNVLTFTNLHGKKHQRGKRANPKAASTLEYITQEVDKDGKPKCVMTSVLDLEATIAQFERVRDYSDSSYKEKEVHHFAISFDSESGFDPLNEQDQRLLFDFTARLTEEVFPNNDSEWSIHADTDNLHVNIVTNAFNRDGHGKLQMGYNFFQEEVYPIIDKLEKEFGLEPSNLQERVDKNREEKKKGTYHENDSGEIQMKKHGRVGWKQEIIKAVSEAKFEATSMEEFDSLIEEQGVRRYQRSKTKFGYEHIGRLETHEAKHARITNGNRTLKENKLTLEDIEKQFEKNKIEKQSEKMIVPFDQAERKTKRKKKTLGQKNKTNQNISSQSPNAWILKMQEKEKIFESDREKLKNCQSETEYQEVLKQLEVKNQLDEWAEQSQKKHEQYIKDLEKLSPSHSMFEDILDETFDSIINNIFEDTPEYSKNFYKKKEKESQMKLKKLKIALNKKKELQGEYQNFYEQNSEPEL